MHIVIDAHLAVKEIDGVARYLIGLLTHLPKIDPKIHYSILTLPEQKSSLPKEIFAGKNVRRVELDLDGPSPKQHIVTRKLLHELKPDVYHHPQYDLPRGLSIPAVITIHDLKYIFRPEFLKHQSLLKTLYIKTALAYSIKKADRIISVSESTLNDLVDFGLSHKKKVKVIYHGTDFAEKSSVNSQKIGIDFSNDFVLFVGTRRPHKNLENLIEAISILRNTFVQKVELVVSGKTYGGYQAPEKMASELAIGDHVHFLDFVTDEKLRELYCKAKIIVLPSFYEGFGFPLIEGMAFGKPVVGSNVSSIPEVVGNAGLLVDPNSVTDIASKLNRLLSDSTLYETLSANALQRAKLFSWQSVAETTLQVYLDAAS